MSIPFLKVDTMEQAETVQMTICRRMYDGRMVINESSGFAKGHAGTIKQATEYARAAYERMFKKGGK